ncbi:bifunctional 3-oxoadipate enol-lactonase/4-carboxymuconolactone decarboxylase PcaDC [Microtetraspora malaysiensis]|uniref:3-oxoadipate enol-lactonase n=1 Tax=Microtetraspora malaysiensis TaxID=161358 RepID=A0ABW6SNS7_9ACTN
MKPAHAPGSPGRLHHRADGRRDAPALLLGPSLGTTLSVWDPQVPALARDHRVVRWDLPGHGGSPSVLGEGATVADLAGLVLDLADALGVDRFHYAGVSLGGAVGAWLALHHPDRVASLTMVCSSARFGPEETWRERAALVRAKGTGIVADSAARRWFTPAFTEAAPFLDELREVAADGYAACCDALATYDIRAELGRITAPTLVIGGRDDVATTPAHARELADGIPGATLVEIPGAAHLAGVERPGPVLTALLTHLEGGGPARADGSRRYAAGMGVRRAVLGDAHVDRATANADSFTADFQDFITRYAWGEIWTRPGLDRRTRSCVTLTALVAGGHLEELAMHVRAALRNGLTPDEIKEVLLQAAVYCGVPAANAAFAVAQRTLNELQERNT